MTDTELETYLVNQNAYGCLQRALLAILYADIIANDKHPIEKTLRAFQTDVARHLEITELQTHKHSDKIKQLAREAVLPFFHNVRGILVGRGRIEPNS